MSSGGGAESEMSGGRKKANSFDILSYNNVAQGSANGNGNGSGLSAVPNKYIDGFVSDNDNDDFDEADKVEKIILKVVCEC